MAYFDGVKIGDKVWHFEFGWGIVKKLLRASDLDSQNFVFENDFSLIEVKFDNERFENGYFDFDGVAFYSNSNQTLFWDEIKFEIPKKPKIKLRETKFLICLNDNKVDNDEEFKKARIGDYTSENGLFRNDKETARIALKQIKIFSRLLALKDQECSNSRGYEFSHKNNYYIYYNDAKGKYMTFKYSVFIMGAICFKTAEDAQKICNILNSDRF